MKRAYVCARKEKAVTGNIRGWIVTSSLLSNLSLLVIQKVWTHSVPSNIKNYECIGVEEHRSHRSVCLRRVTSHQLQQQSQTKQILDLLHGDIIDHTGGHSMTCYDTRWQDHRSLVRISDRMLGDFIRFHRKRTKNTKKILELFKTPVPCSTCVKGFPSGSTS